MSCHEKKIDFIMKLLNARLVKMPRTMPRAFDFKAIDATSTIYLSHTSKSKTQNYSRCEN